MPPNYYRRKFVGPVIAEGAVAKYLERKLDSWDWIKKVPRFQLLRELGDFQFSEAGRPMLHQLMSLVLGTELPQFLYFIDMGGGKSALTFALYRWHREHSNIRRGMLIMVPREVNVQSWIDEIEIWAPQLTYTTLVGGTEQRREALAQEQKDIYIINYPGLQTLMSSLEPVRGKKKRKRQVDPKLAKEFASRFDMVVLDESHRIGNMQSLVYRLCRYFTKYSRIRYAMTGTPFGRDPQMLFPQFHVIDDGETLGQTLGLFRAAFYNSSENYWGGIDYDFDHRMESDLHDMMKHRSIYFPEKEWEDNRKRQTSSQRVRVRFSTSAKEQYNNVIKRIKESYGSIEERKNSFVRMRMCTSGYLSVRSDIEGRLTMYFDENPKLDMLEEMVGDIPHASKMIIFHDYILTGALIGKMLRKNKLPFATLSGQTKDQMQQMRLFLHDDKVRFLVANSDSGSTGINPQEVANYMVFYESPVSPITRKQAVKRIDRTGQKKHCHFYDLVVPGTVDEDILDFLEEGKSLFDAIVAGKKKFEEVK